MPTRIPLCDLPEHVQRVVYRIGEWFKIVPVAIDLNCNAGYVALVHVRRVHDPYDPCLEIAMPFEVTLSNKREILTAYASVGTVHHPTAFAAK